MASPRSKQIPTDVRRKELVQLVIELTKTVPYQEITARRIASEAGIDPRVIFRCFPTIEALFLAALTQMQADIVTQLSQGAGGDIKPLEMAQNQIRFALWLSLSGTDPQQISNTNDGQDLTQKKYSLDRIGFPEEAGDRAASAVYALMLIYLAAQATVAPLQGQTFSPEVMGDVGLLLFTLSQKMPELAAELGWIDVRPGDKNH